MSSDQSSLGLMTDIFAVLDRHGYTSADTAHTARAILLISDLAHSCEGSLDHPFGPAIGQPPPQSAPEPPSPAVVLPASSARSSRRWMRPCCTSATASRPAPAAATSPAAPASGASRPPRPTTTWPPSWLRQPKPPEPRRLAAPNLSVQGRMARQQLLDRENAPSFEAVVDESVLHRVVGSRSVMRAQLERLLELSERPKVTLRVIPYEAGALPTGNNKFIILRFASAEVKDVVFIEGLTRDLYLDDPDEVETYNTTFRTLVQLAASTDTTRAIIAAMIPSYSPPPLRR